MGVSSAITEVCSRAGMFVIASDGPWHGGPDSGAEYVPIDLEKFVLDEKYQDERTYQLRAALPKSTNRLTLINNAAMQVLCAQPPTNPNDWNKTFCVNTFAPAMLAARLLPDLARWSGHVINISSVHAKLTKPNFMMYAASKAALESITRSLAIEWGPVGIRVNTVAPAAIGTEMLLAGFADNPKSYEALKEFHPVKKIGTTSDFALFIKSIIEGESQFLSGSLIDFSGAISVRLHDPD